MSKPSQQLIPVNFSLRSNNIYYGQTLRTSPILTSSSSSYDSGYLVFNNRINGNQITLPYYYYNFRWGTLSDSTYGDQTLNAGYYTNLNVSLNVELANQFVYLETTVSMTIYKTTPLFSIYVNTMYYGLTYDQILDQIQGTITNPYNSQNVSGTFTITNGTNVPNIGEYVLVISFVPTDNSNYETTNTQLNVRIVPADIISTWPSTSSITYGTQLSQVTLGYYLSSGTFTFINATAVLSVGTSTQQITFTPNDTTNYNIQTTSISVTVQKADPVITWPIASTITYGNTLSQSTFSGSTTVVSGTFLFTNATAVLSVGTSTQPITFTPNDITNYNIQTTSIYVTVQKADPIITWPIASTITYGNTLSQSILSGYATLVSGTFVFTNATSTLITGTSLQPITFAPIDTSNYNIQTTSISVTVQKADPVITWPIASTITYGNTLSQSTLSGYATLVSGTFVFTNATSILITGTITQQITFTPIDTSNYNIQTSSISVVVQKADPVITWPIASTITYGNTLSQSTLSGYATLISGTFVFTNATSVLIAGSSTQQITFTPHDITNYNIQTTSIYVTVQKADPIITWPIASITYGNTLSQSTLSGYATLVSGTFVFTNATSVLIAGTSSQLITFTPNDITNYNIQTTSISVTVQKAVPVITEWPYNMTIVKLGQSMIDYNKTIVEIILDGGISNVSGIFTVQEPISTDGTAIIIFTPENDSYETIRSDLYSLNLSINMKGICSTKLVKKSKINKKRQFSTISIQ